MTQNQRDPDPFFFIIEERWLFIIIVIALLIGFIANSETCSHIKDNLTSFSLPSIKRVHKEVQRKAYKATPEDELKGYVQQWERAWESNNISLFMGYYSPRFSSRGLDYSSLRDYQARIFSGSPNISLSITRFKVESLSDNHAVISFNQYLEIDNQCDKGFVRMSLLKEHGQWLIYEESWESLN